MKCAQLQLHSLFKQLMFYLDTVCKGLLPKLFPFQESIYSCSSNFLVKKQAIQAGTVTLGVMSTV